MKRTGKLIAGLAGIAMALGSAPAAQAADLVIGTSSPGGSYFLIGGGLSTSVSRDVEGVSIATRTTAGSTTNMRMLTQPNGGLQLGLANLGVVYTALTGTGKFEGQPPAKNVRAVMALTISPLHWVTLASSDIKSFSDLKGKRVSLAKAGSGTAANADVVLKAIGIRDDIKPQFLGFSESGDALRDGNLDAFVVASAVPVPVVTAMAATRKMRLIPLNADELKAVLKQNPAYAPYTIKASAYGDVEADAQSFGVPSTIMTQDSVPDDVIYKFVKYVFSEKSMKYMKTVYSSWSPTPGFDEFKNVGAPMHPGAIKAYKELGMMK